MDFEEFKQKFRISLTSQQLAAVQRVDGPTLLLAVPGSGKTTVLVTRLGYMIYCCSIMPESILTLTYTVSATKDMADRFCRVFGEDLRNRLEFRTINGICARVLYYYGKCIGKEMYPLISKEEERKGILAGIYRRITNEYAAEGDLQEIGAQITYIKNMMMTEEELRAYDGKSNYPILLLYQAYTAELKRQKRIDFDDQMIYAWKILKSVPQVLQFFQKKYCYICVDEAQDTSRIQHAIIALLAEDNENLFMVGDEDQSIYGFRAAYPQALLNFENDHPRAKVLLMEKNFRSDAGIVQAADAFIQKNTLRHRKHMTAARDGKTEISEIRVRSRKAQYAYLSRMAASLYTDGNIPPSPIAEESGMQSVALKKMPAEPGKTIAVLYRDNECAIPLIDLLERDHIPYNIRNSDPSFFSHRIITDIRSILHFAGNPLDTNLFLQIYYKLKLYMDKQTAEKVIRLSQEHEMPVLDAALRYGKMPAYMKEHCMEMRELLSDLRTDSSLDAINRIEKDMGYGDYLKRSSLSDRKLFILKTLAAREETPEDLLLRLDLLQQIIREKNHDPMARLILSTIHGSKGLEYDTVYLLDVCDRVFPEDLPLNPKKLSGTELETWEEERRLFYVGVTRAKNNLYLFQIQNENTTFIDEFLKNYQRKKQKTVAISQPDSNEEAFRQFCGKLGEGVIVEHKKFGRGAISAMTDRTVTVAFEDGEKTLGLKVLFQKKLLQ